MRFAPDLLRMVGDLVRAGQWQALQARMLELWPPDAVWYEEDVQVVTELLLVLKQRCSEAPECFYAPFKGRLKRDGSDYPWLRGLPQRIQVVLAYEGSEQTMAWLRDLAERTESPQRGVVYLELGKLLLSQGHLAAARAELRRAVSLSMCSVGWYILHAFDVMTLCLVREGRATLAFEYAKTRAIYSYIVGQLSAELLFKACKGLANIFGQIDYWIEFESNIAREAALEREWPRAAVAESNSGIVLTLLGATEEAAKRFRRAAQHARQAPRRVDQLYSLSCRLLARYVDPLPISQDELNHLFSEMSGVASLPMIQAVVQATCERLSERFPLDTFNLERWGAVCREDRGVATPSREAEEELVAFRHLAAILARFHEEGSAHGESAFLCQAVLDGARGRREAVVLLVQVRFAEALLRAERFTEALEVSSQRLADATLPVLERFIFRQLAARSQLGLRQKQEAHTLAAAAIRDWKRVLAGLYVERHKVAWLGWGESALGCAIASLREPVSWMDEDCRYRELFRLVELSKARIVSDMVARGDYLPGPFLIAEVSQYGPDWLFRLKGEDEELIPPLTIQMSVFPDFLMRVSHDDHGGHDDPVGVNLAPLRCGVQMSLTAEQRLLATADSLAFEATDAPVDQDLFDDYRRPSASAHPAPGN